MTETSLPDIFGTLADPTRLATPLNRFEVFDVGAEGDDCDGQ